MHHSKPQSQFVSFVRVRACVCACVFAVSVLVFGFVSLHMFGAWQNLKNKFCEIEVKAAEQQGTGKYVLDLGFEPQSGREVCYRLAF